mmetsp:Transcript_2850/g.6196  ORF Transcript_2850/g.6196 Transcript_2850/m.6196 type:complete len:415 (+) Transcript_2850:397-1641(+)
MRGRHRQTKARGNEHRHSCTQLDRETTRRRDLRELLTNGGNNAVAPHRQTKHNTSTSHGQNPYRHARFPGRVRGVAARVARTVALVSSRSHLTSVVIEREGFRRERARRTSQVSKASLAVEVLSVTNHTAERITVRNSVTLCKLRTIRGGHVLLKLVRRNIRDVTVVLVQEEDGGERGDRVRHVVRTVRERIKRGSENLHPRENLFGLLVKLLGVLVHGRVLLLETLIKINLDVDSNALKCLRGLGFLYPTGGRVLNLLELLNLPRLKHLALVRNHREPSDKRGQRTRSKRNTKCLTHGEFLVKLEMGRALVDDEEHRDRNGKEVPDRLRGERELGRVPAAEHERSDEQEDDDGKDSRKQRGDHPRGNYSDHPLEFLHTAAVRQPHDRATSTVRQTDTDERSNDRVRRRHRQLK